MKEGGVSLFCFPSAAGLKKRVCTLHTLACVYAAFPFITRLPLVTYVCTGFCFV